jgi:hypothetical protein
MVCYQQSFRIKTKRTHSFISVEAVDGPRTLNRTFAAWIDPLLGRTYCLGVA